MPVEAYVPRVEIVQRDDGRWVVIRHEEKGYCVLLNRRKQPCGIGSSMNLAGAEHHQLAMAYSRRSDAVRGLARFVALAQKRGYKDTADDWSE